MKTLITILALLLWTGWLKAQTQSIGGIEIPEFPYQSYLDSLNTENESLTIKGDNGFSFISDKIAFLMPDEIGNRNTRIDSLIDFYNAIIIYNTSSYDIGTIARYISDTDSSQVLLWADAFRQINFSMVKDPGIRNALKGVFEITADNLKQGIIVSNSNEAVGECNKLMNGYYEQISCFGQLDPDAGFNLEEVIDDYADIHKAVINDDLNIKDELLYKTLQEKDFVRKCVYAREFAYANYRDPDYKLLVAVLDPILKSGEYSPLLTELWLMWRTTLQIYILGGRSNDSCIYNLFYNDMRNLIALTYLRHFMQNPDDSIVLHLFTELACAPNIVRNSPCLFGNNANLDDMQLYYELWGDNIEN